MKKILILLCITNLSSWAADYPPGGNSWRDLCPSSAQLVGLLMASSLFGQALAQADNCTVSSSGPFTDAETIRYTWWQIGTGIFATVLIGNNFLAAWYFYKRQEKELGKLLQDHIAELIAENEQLEETKEMAERLIIRLRNLPRNRP